MKNPNSTTSAIKIVQPARSNAAIVRHAKPQATTKEVSASMCSCVVHLCGCE